MGQIQLLDRNMINMIAALICLCAANIQAETGSLEHKGVIYRNPRVYNVEYSFEMFPEPNKIDRSKDLKLWIPIPREWDSQKAVKIISVKPEPHARYTDPEHGNPMLFWDFGKELEKPSYKVDIKYRLEQYEVDSDIEPNKIGLYDKTSKEYILYTRSTHTINITSKVKELVKQAVGDEKNPYLQAEQIFKFIRKNVRYELNRLERGVGTEALLNNPVYDEDMKSEYYEGQCAQQAILFVAMCRSVGIPARTIQGFIHHNPWIQKEDLKPFTPRELELSSSGLAGAQHYLAGIPHVWAEFYIPNYGWIPADLTRGRFARLNNEKIITDKGCDILIGPNAPQTSNEGYGFQWIPMTDGRVDELLSGIWNIAKIRIAKVTLLHHSDPFPADAFAGYSAEAEEVDQALILIDDVTRGQPDKEAALEKAYKENPQFWHQLEPFICHMLRKVVGDEKFFEIYDTYINLRIKSCEPVSTARFEQIAEAIYGKPLDWFFNQWSKHTVLPQLKLDAVTFSKDEEGWYVRGNLRQLSSKLFRLSVELVVETEGPTERKEIWIDSRNSSFEFTTSNRPKRIIVDPDKDILQIREMPPHLIDFWSSYPNLLIVYGTIAEKEANKAAVGSFTKLDPNIVKADVDVNDADLKGKCLILFGRPDTNKIVGRFESLFPIKFDGNKFTWRGKTYDKPSHGAAQIVEGPNDSAVLIIQFTALSAKAMRNLDSNYLSFKTSYVIFDGDKTLFLDNWQHGNKLTWEFDKDKTEYKY